MVRRGSRDRGKEWYWRRVLRQWRRSGQSVRWYCLEHGLSEPSFYAWRRTIEERNQQLARRTQLRGRRRAKARVEDRDDQRGPREALPAFVPVTMTPPLTSLEVVFGEGYVIRVAAGFDTDTLRQLLAVLREAPPC
jgi:hypothetical protein